MSFRRVVANRVAIMKSLRCMACVALFASGVAALAQTTLNVALGSTSSVQTATVTLSGGGKLSSILVLTEGINNQDFQLSSYSCQPGTTYSAGQVCTIGYTFAPKYAGLRRGGITLLDNGGDILGMAFISGIGTGPEIAIYPSSSSFPAGTRVAFTAPNPPQFMSIDGAGNIYYYTRNASTANGSIVKATLNSDGSYTQNTIWTFSGVAGSRAGVTGLAVDGMGNVYYTLTCAVIQLVPYKTGYAANVVLQKDCADLQGELAIDGNGAIYIASFGYGYNKYPYRGTGYSDNGPGYTPGSKIVGSYSPNDIFVDANANLYAADNDGSNPLIEAYENAATGAYTQQYCCSQGFFPPSTEGSSIFSLFLNPNGSMVYGNGSNQGVTQLHHNGTLTGLVSNVSYVITTIRMDAQGDIFFLTSDPTNNVYEIPVTPTVAFGSVASGTTQVQNFSIMNIGNVTLTARSPGLQVNSSPFGQSTSSSHSPSDCGATFSLATDGICTLNLAFSPPSSANGAYSATLSVDDNTLSSSSAVQQIAVSGTAVHSPPTITSISPSRGGAIDGSTFVITGTYLGDVSSVKFTTCYGSYNQSFTINSTTQITTTSALGCPSDTGTITITNPGGTATTTWTYNALASASNSSLQISAPSVPQTGTATLTATVKDSSGNPIVNDLVTFTSSVTGIASAPSAVTNSSGVATATVTGLIPGSTVMSAQAYGASITQTVALTVTDASVAVGSNLTGQQGVLTITTAGTLSSALALSQGASNTDFTLTANSCQTGASYAVGATCTVTYTASPKAPGLRNGAIMMENSSGAPLGTLYLSVIGTGPQALFSPGAQSTVSSQSSVLQSVVDGLGNVYYVLANGQIIKLVGGTTTLLAFSSGPGGLTLDGAGNLFYTDTFYRKVYELVNATGTAQVVATFNSTSTLSGPIAADALGNLYVTDSGTLYKLAAGTFATSTVASGVVAPAGMVVDAAGNVYFSERTQGIISEIASGTSSVISIATGLSSPTGLALDAAGNIYVCSQGSLVRLAAGSRSSSFIATNTSAFTSVWITGNSNVWAATSTGIIALNRAASAAAFSANVGSASSPQVITLEDDGNTSLTLAGLSTTAPFSLDSGTTTCTATTTLAAAGTCTLGIVFTPSAVGAASGTTNVKDNSLNVTGTIQTISLSGSAYATQTITFPQPVTPTLPNTTATLTASATSGLPITYTVLSGPATISGSTVTYTDSGTVIISASQSGNASYAPASSVSVTVIVAGLNTAVGTTGSTQTIQVTISAAGTLQTINALTQGASNLDYKYVTGSTDPNACKVGTPYALNTVCTVQYSFTPSRPGQRLGAISLTSTTASVMGTALLSGIGTGPMVTFPGSSAISTLETGLANTIPTAIAVNGNGDVFFANASGALSKAIAVNGVVTASSQVVAVGSTTLQPQYIAVDGAGDVFVTDLFNGTNSKGTVTEVVAVNGVVSSTSAVVIVADNLNYPQGLAVDGSGDLFVSASQDNVVKEVVAVNGKVSTSSVVNTVSGVISQPEGLAVDASGDVFVALPNYGAVLEIVAVNGLINPSSTTINFNTGFYGPYGVAIDGSGDVFVADPGSMVAATKGQGAALKEIVAVNGAVSSSSAILTLGGGFQARGVALDGLGHIFVADTNSGTDKELDLTVAPTLAFVSGSAALSTTVQNAGNTALTFTGLATSSSNFTLDTTATTCNVATSLAADGLCVVGADFTPQASGALTGNISLTDNSLNIAGNQQQVPLTGTRGTTAQTITFPQPATPVANGSAPVTLTATASSGIPVTYSVISGPATVSGTTLTYTGTGTVVVEADQVGNAAYTAAVPVQRTIAVVAVTNYAAPTTAVGSTSVTQTATVTLPVGGTLGAIIVVTQGTQNLDFKLASGGTCSSGAVFTAGQSCTVNYSFKPTAPGARQGAVLLYSNDATPAVLATVFLGATGTGPLAVFSQGVQSTFASVAYPNDAAFDGDGNLYVSDLISSTLDRITPAGVVSQLVTGVNRIAGVGVDGAGNVFYASSGSSNISELVGASGVPSVSVVIGASDPDNSLVFDAAGNFYVELNNNGTIWKYNPEANSGSQILQGSNYGIGRVIGMTQDAAGNLYLADFTHSSVYVLNTGATVPTLLTSAGLSSPDGIAVDAAGNLYVSNYGASASNGIASLVKIPAGCTTTSCQTVLATGFSATFTKIDSSGNLYVGDLTDGSVIKITRTTTAALSYAATPVNTSSAQQIVTLENDGTSSLSFSAITGSNANSGGAATTCAIGTQLTSAATCNLGVRFAPTLPTTASGTLTLTDNTLNNSASTQIISLIGASSNNAQTITFSQPATPVTPGSTAVLTATASSGLPVSFAVQSGPATISTVAGVSTITYGPGSGAVMILASQAGNATYSAATSVSRTVTVAAAAVITFSPPASPVLAGSSATLVASSTQSATPIVFTVVSGLATISGSTVTYNGAGTVVIAATQAGTANYPAAATVDQSVTVVRITSTTALAVTVAGSSVTATTSGTIITLKATVLAGSSPMPRGQVNFCDGTPCTLSHLLGTAQVVQSGSALGTATFRYSPGLGVHSFTAVFVQTNADASSTSAPAALTVTSPTPNTVTTLSVSGSVGYYTLTGSVTGSLAAAPSGTLGFLDTTNSNAQVASAPLVAGPSTFTSSKNVLPGVDNYPQSMAVGDFNNDGIPDFVTANGENTTANVLLSTGYGQYLNDDRYSSGSYCYATAVADFNGDGNADMAVDCANEVDILLGYGNGIFREGTPFVIPTNAYSTAIATGDFNGDGIADLAVTNTVLNTYYGGSSITIFLGKGDGTFTQGASPTTGNEPYAIAVSDFNGDGVLDLAVVNQYDKDVTILLGNGDGTFTAQAASPSTVQNPDSVTVGDFNGDGIADLAVASEGNSNLINVLQGNGDGSFTPLASPNLGTHQYPYFVGAGDLDGDGYTDLATTNLDISTGNMTVTTLHSNGDGTFAAPVTSIANTPGGQSYYPGGIVVADMNGDGLADVAEVSTSQYDSATVTYDLGAIFLSSVSTTATATATGISPAGTGTHYVEALFQAEGSYTGSVSPPIALTALTRQTKTITFPALASNVTLGSTATLTATASNGDPVTFSITSGIATLTSTTLTYSTVGAVTITASSAATSTYNAATPISQTINVLPPPAMVFIAGSGGVASLNALGSVTTPATAGGSTGLAVDAAGYVWSLNGSSLTQYSPAGALSATFTPTGINSASALAIDGNSNIVVANGNGVISVVSNAGVTVSTTAGSTTSAPSSVAIDSSGNIWVANPTANTVDEVIGGAAPASPLANAVQSATPGVKP